VAGWANVRRRGRRLGPGRRTVVAAVLPVLVVAALAGCGQADDDSLSSSAPDGAATATADPGGQPTTPQPSPAPAAPTPDDGSGGGGTAAGPGGSGGAATPGATDGAASGGTGNASAAPPSGEASAAATPTAPIVSASPVFVGEPCAPELDTAPAVAINGLTLYCAPPSAGAAGPGSWSNLPPQQQQQGPAPGAECDSSDAGQVQKDPSGRPVACLREPNGEFRWADIS